MSKNDTVDIIPADGIMFVKLENQIYMVVTYKKDDDYVAISIPVKEVVKHLKEDGYVVCISEKPKDRMVV
jgi:hypothetical protein